MNARAGVSTDVSKSNSERLLARGWWLLVVGVFTSWLLGLGLLFILAAAICGFVGLFRERVLRSSLLLLSSLVLGFVCLIVALHMTAIAGIYAYNRIPASRPAHVPDASVTDRE